MATDKVQFDILVNASKAEKALNDFARTVEKTVGKVSKKLESMEKSFDSIAKSIRAIDKNNSMDGLSKDIKKSNKELKEMEKSLKNINRLQRGVGASGSRTSRGRMSSGGNRIMSGAKGLVGGLGAYSLMGLIGGIPESGIKFESTMTDLEGILSSKGGLNGLDSKIRDVGKNSSYTINEMAGAAKFMAMAGMDSGQIGGSLSSVSNLGMVGNLGVERSADIITNIMSSMGLDPSKKGYTTAVSDIITGTFTNSNVSIEEIGQSMSYVGNIAAQVGMDIKETSTAIGILGNNGIKASRAGTGLRQMFLKLAAPTKAGQETIDALGLNLYEIGKNGKRQLKPLSNILTQIKDSGAGAKELKSIFGVYGQQAVGALVSSLDKYNELSKSIGGSGNLTENLAEKKRNTTAGRVFLLKSKWEDFSITLMDRVRPAFDFILNGLTKLIEKLSTNQKFLTWVENAANGMAKALEIAYHVLKFLFNLIMDNEVAVLGVLSGIATWLSLIAAKSLIVAIANPFTPWLIAGVGVLALMDKMASSVATDPNSPDGAVTKEVLAGRYRDRIIDSGTDDWMDWINPFADTPTDASGKKKTFSSILHQRNKGSMFWGLSDDEVIKLYQEKYATEGEMSQFRRDSQKARMTGGKVGSYSDKWKKSAIDYVKDLLPKGGSSEKLLKQIEAMESNIGGNVGGLSVTGKEGDSVGTLASPLTSQANEMSRSIVVNIHDGLLHVDNQNVGVGSDGTLDVGDMEQQMADVLTKVVSDFELSMSR